MGRHIAKLTGAIVGERSAPPLPVYTRNGDSTIGACGRGPSRGAVAVARCGDQGHPLLIGCEYRVVDGGRRRTSARDIDNRLLGPIVDKHVIERPVQAVNQGGEVPAC